MKARRADDALRTVSALMASPDGTVPKIDCAAWLREWEQDPARRASRDCECFDSERPPRCVPKGTKMPELKEGGYSFYWILDFRTSEGQMNITDGSHTGKYKTYDAALRGCQEEARGRPIPLTGTLSENRCPRRRHRRMCVRVGEAPGQEGNHLEAAVTTRPSSLKPRPCNASVSFVRLIGLMR